MKAYWYAKKTKCGYSTSRANPVAQKSRRLHRSTIAEPWRGRSERPTFCGSLRFLAGQGSAALAYRTARGCSGEIELRVVEMNVVIQYHFDRGSFGEHRIRTASD